MDQCLSVAQTRTLRRQRSQGHPVRGQEHGMHIRVGAGAPLRSSRHPKSQARRERRAIWLLFLVLGEAPWGTSRWGTSQHRADPYCHGRSRGITPCEHGQHVAGLESFKTATAAHLSLDADHIRSHKARVMARSPQSRSPPRSIMDQQPTPFRSLSSKIFSGSCDLEARCATCHHTSRH